jgi:hypothetical protein
VNNPEESIQHSEHGESLKSRIVETCLKKSVGTHQETIQQIHYQRQLY